MNSKLLAASYLSEIQTRRRFLRQACCAVAGTAAMSNVLRDLRFINAATAQTITGTDYKALICVFLNGGNDSNNLIIPTLPAEWTSYAATRNSGVANLLAIPNTDGGPATALALNSLNGQPGYPADDHHTYGLHPAMPELQGMFNNGQAAIMLNVGSLAYPITKAQYFANSVPVPPQLFSHSDQQAQWQTSIPDKPPSSGWGGRIADLMTAPGGNLANGLNGYPSQISMAVTLAGSNIFQVGSSNYAPEYSVSTTGATNLLNITGDRYNAFTTILNGTAGSTSGTAGDLASPDLQTSAYANVVNSALAEASAVTTALGHIGTTPSYLSPFTYKSSQYYVVTPNTVYTNNPKGFSSSLMQQMAMVVKLIDIGKNQLGMKRQIFFIQVGGYDTHTVQTQSSATNNPTVANVIIGNQANLLAELSTTLYAFYQSMVLLGNMNDSYHTPDSNMANNVTAFTVSDFNRTFPCNGTGSDHGWGGHHIVVGGAVKGSATYGILPTLAVNGPSDTGTGRWIPTTSVDQYAATLATWYGVDPGNLLTIFPNLGRFATNNLGFMKAPV